MALLAIVTMLLATLALTIGRSARLNELTTKRNLALAQQAGRVGTMPLTDVAQLSNGTTQMLVGDFTFNRRLTVTASGTNRYTVRIVVAPVAGEFKPDSVTIERTRPPSGTPLCTTC